MDAFTSELLSYMNESEARGNKVISINGVRAMLERHQTHIMPPQRRFQTTEEHLHLREQTRLYGANTRVN